MTTSEDSEMKDELSGIAIEVHSIGPDGLDLPMEKPSECSGCLQVHQEIQSISADVESIKGHIASLQQSVDSLHNKIAKSTSVNIEILKYLKQMESKFSSFTKEKTKKDSSLHFVDKTLPVKSVEDFWTFNEKIKTDKELKENFIVRVLSLSAENQSSHACVKLYPHESLSNLSKSFSDYFSQTRTRISRREVSRDKKMAMMENEDFCNTSVKTKTKRPSADKKEMVVKRAKTLPNRTEACSVRLRSRRRTHSIDDEGEDSLDKEEADDVEPKASIVTVIGYYTGDNNPSSLSNSTVQYVPLEEEEEGEEGENKDEEEVEVEEEEEEEEEEKDSSER
ncbi:hypothetical protein M8J75_001519 [Diaphorina citri]|nr:hypothetical protein M8J75_001519 [Diaphorina citri]